MNDLTDVRSGVVGAETDEQSKANFLHQSCLNAADNIKQNIKVLCENLSIIKDENLYLLLGSTSFNNYCETSLNIGRLQAHKYYIVGCFLRSFETVYPGKQNITDCNSFTDLGIEKMYLLASLKAGELQTIQENTDLVSISKRDLKTKISDLRALQQVKETSKFSGSIADFKKSVNVVSDKYNELVSNSLDCVQDPLIFQYYSLLNELRSIFDSLKNLQDTLNDSYEFAFGMYAFPRRWSDSLLHEIKSLEINFDLK